MQAPPFLGLEGLTGQGPVHLGAGGGDAILQGPSLLDGTGLLARDAVLLPTTNNWTATLSESSRQYPFRSTVSMASAGSMADGAVGAGFYGGRSSTDNISIQLAVDPAAFEGTAFNPADVQQWLNAGLGHLAGAIGGLLRLLGSGRWGRIFAGVTDFVIVVSDDATAAVLRGERLQGYESSNPLAGCLAAVARLLVQQCEGEFNVLLTRTNRDFFSPAGAMLHLAHKLARAACSPAGAEPNVQDVLGRQVPCTCINMTITHLAPLQQLPQDIDWANPVNLGFKFNVPLPPMFPQAPKPVIQLPEIKKFDVLAAVLKSIERQEAAAAARKQAAEEAAKATGADGVAAAGSAGAAEVMTAEEQSVTKAAGADGVAGEASSAAAAAPEVEAPKVAATKAARADRVAAAGPTAEVEAPPEEAAMKAVGADGVAAAAEAAAREAHKPCCGSKRKASMDADSST